MLTIFNDRKILKTLKFSAMTASCAVFLPDDNSITSGTNDYKSQKKIAVSKNFDPIENFKDEDDIADGFCHQNTIDR